jgi:hypothetical protein
MFCGQGGWVEGGKELSVLFLGFFMQILKKLTA